MIAYFDTSALIKRLFDEPGSEITDEVWGVAGTVVASQLVYPEARAAIAGAQRSGRIGPKKVRQLVHSLEEMCCTIEVLRLGRRDGLWHARRPKERCEASLSLLAPLRLKGFYGDDRLRRGRSVDAVASRGRR